MSIITMPVTEAKQRFTEIVKRAEDYFDRYLVTKNGREAAVVMSAEEYESLLETLDVLANKKEIRALTEASAQVKRGEMISLKAYRIGKTRSPRRGKQR